MPWGLLIFSSLCLTALLLIGFATAGLFTKTRNRKGVLIQAYFRSNTAVLGLPLAILLGGEKTEAISSALMSMVIFYNAYAVIALGMYEPADGQVTVADRVKKIFTNAAKNPLIRGIVLGILCLIIRQLEPVDADGHAVFSLQYDLPSIYTALTNLGKIASPMMLIILGARFEFSAVKGLLKEIIAGTAIRNLVAPAFCFVMLYLFGSRLQLFPAGPDVYRSMIGVFATPVAVSSAVMAAEMHGDESLAGQLVVWTTILCPVSLFVFIVVLRSLGLM